MQSFSYETPRSPSEAVSAFVKRGPGTSYIAGGTSLYDMMKLHIARPRHLIDLTRMEGLDGVETKGDQIILGALAPMSAIAANSVLKRDYAVLAESLSKAASQQLRNMATIGGNLLQRTRCLYFRNGTGNPSSVGSYPCNKRLPGSGCAAIGGLDRGQAVLGGSDSCTAVSAGDWPVALVAMRASVQLFGATGERTIPVGELYRLPGDTPHREFAIGPEEIITAIVVPKTSAGRASTYHKVRDREGYAFALASAAVALDLAGGRVRQAHIALGGVATIPWRAEQAERALLGHRLTYAAALEAGRVAFDSARLGKLNAFKVELGRRTVADALMIAAERSR